MLHVADGTRREIGLIIDACNSNAPCQRSSCTGVDAGLFDSSVAALLNDGIAEVEQVVEGLVGEFAVLGAIPDAFDRIHVGA